MKLHSSLLAPLVVAAFLGIIVIGGAWELPSMQKEFSETSGRIQTVNMIVKGLRCRGTSNFFMKAVGEIPGVVSVSTFVQEHRAQIKYDPSQIDPEGLARMVEKPVKLPNGRMVAPFKVLEIKE